MAGSTSPKKKAATPASQDKKKSAAAPAKDGTGADIRNFVSPPPPSFEVVTDGAVLARI